LIKGYTGIDYLTFWRFDRILPTCKSYFCSDG